MCYYCLCWHWGPVAVPACGAVGPHWIGILLKAPGVGGGGWLVVGCLHLTAVWPWKQKPWQPAGLMKIEALRRSTVVCAQHLHVGAHVGPFISNIQQSDDTGSVQGRSRYALLLKFV